MRGRRPWLLPLLIVLVLIAGAVAIVVIRVTAPDAPAETITLGELLDRAASRLREWGLLEP